MASETKQEHTSTVPGKNIRSIDALIDRTRAAITARMAMRFAGIQITENRIETIELPETVVDITLSESLKLLCGERKIIVDRQQLEQPGEAR